MAWKTGEAWGLTATLSSPLRWPNQSAVMIDDHRRRRGLVAADLDCPPRDCGALVVGVVDHAHGQPQDALLDRLERGQIRAVRHGCERIAEGVVPDWGRDVPAHHPPRTPDVRRPPLGAAARRVGVGADGDARRGHLPPRRALRRLRRATCTPSRSCRRPRRPRVPAPAGARGGRGCRWWRRSAWPAAGATDDGDPLDAVLITRHLEFSLPYRALFAGRACPTLREPLLDALAQLLVRLHLAGFFWGDCSLSNTLFRRDAGALPPTWSMPRRGSCTPTPVRRAAGPRPADRRPRTSPASCSTSRGRRGDLDEPSIRCETAADDLARRYERPVGRADARGGRRRRRAAPHRRARSGASTSWASTSRSWSWSAPATAAGCGSSTRVVEPGHHRPPPAGADRPRRAGEPGPRLLNDIPALPRRGWSGTAGDRSPEAVAAYAG